MQIKPFIEKETIMTKKELEKKLRDIWNIQSLETLLSLNVEPKTLNEVLKGMNVDIEKFKKIVKRATKKRSGEKYQIGAMPPPRTCDKKEELIRYYSGEATPQEKEAFDKHVKNCKVCLAASMAIENAGGNSSPETEEKSKKIEKKLDKKFLEFLETAPLVSEMTKKDE